MTDLALPDTSTEGFRCSTWSRMEGLDPIGTTGSHVGYLLADVALPWPADLARLDEVAAVQDVLGGTRIRFQATVPTGEHHVTLYRHAGGPTPELARSSTPVGREPGGLARAAERLVRADVSDVSPISGGLAVRREVLICTHGRRDVCCGARGSRLQMELASSPDLLGPDVVIRRTSHTGGHRFAPTAVVLPEATGWAYLDAEALRAILTRSGPVAAVLGHYRGWAGLESPQLQALERAVLAAVGWDLLDRRRWGEDLGGGVVRLHVDTGVGLAGGASTWEATVVAGRRLPRPECGQPVSETGKTDTELEVTDLRQLRSA